MPVTRMANQTKPCPGQWLCHPLHPQGSPLLQLASNSKASVQAFPTLLPWWNVEDCTRELGSVIPAHTMQGQVNFYQTHKEGKLGPPFPLIPPNIVLLCHLLGLQAPLLVVLCALGVMVLY